MIYTDNLCVSVKRGKYADWSNDSLKLVAKAALVDSCSKYLVAMQFKVPRQTLHDYVKRASCDSRVEKLNAEHSTTL